MLSQLFKSSSLAGLLLGKDVLAATTLMTAAPYFPNSTCPASCTISMPAFEHWSWQPILLTATYIETIILIYDEEKHTTLTSTKKVPIPDDENIQKPYPTNADGTATTTIGVQYLGTTVLAYPTEFVDYPSGYTVGGRFNTSGKCYNDTYITWSSKDLTSLTQPPPTIPPGGDQFGTLYTVAASVGDWPDGWLNARLKDTLPSVCNIVSFAPAAAVQGALLLTTTSMSTLKNTNIGDISPLPPATHTAPEQTTPLAVQDPFWTLTGTTSATAPAAPFVTPVAPLVIGSATVPISLQLPRPGTIPQAIMIGTHTVEIGNTITVGSQTIIATKGPDSAPQAIVIGSQAVMAGQTVNIGGQTFVVSKGPDSAPQAIMIGTQPLLVGNTITIAGQTVRATTGPDSAPQAIVIGTQTVITGHTINIDGQPVMVSASPGTAPQAIVIGTQSVLIGQTVTIGGQTVVATVGPDSEPQIIYGTTTIAVPPAKTPSSDGGMGGYIMSGLGGPDTTDPLDTGSGTIPAPGASALPSSTTAGAAVKIGVQEKGVWYTLLTALLSMF